VQAAVVTNQNSATVAQHVFLRQSIERFPREPASASIPSRHQGNSSWVYTSGSAYFQPYLTATTNTVRSRPLARHWPKDSSLCPSVPPRRGNLQVLLLIVIPLACFGVITGLMPTLVEPTLIEPPRLARDVSFELLVDGIVMNESRGNPNAKNSHSSAMGAGQFLDETWLELIRAHRRELYTGRTDKEVLNLRKNFRLNREMTRHFIERNAAALAKRGLPVTPGTLYLAHFAGPAGAVAILTSRGDEDAATVIASADSRAEVTRAKILNGNPFLRGFTVDDLKTWANIKMESLATR
jgi:hypothetical protein